MFAKHLALLSTLLLILFVSACGPTAAPTSVPAEDSSYPPASEIQAPAATEAPYMPAPANQASGYPTAQAYATSLPSVNLGAAPHPPKTQPYDMFFQDYGVNPSIDTEDDHLSTFALDVDTGSYTIMRNYLSDGFLPPEDSVRVEEYVNYFEQGYPNPPAHQAFGINIDGAPSPFGETDRYQMLRIGIQGYAVPKEERQDASLTFVIDVSGSMNMDNRLGQVKRSLELLVDQLRPRDRVGIVVYGTYAHVLLEPTSGTDRENILRAIYSLQPDGVTNAEAGIRLGYKMAMRAFNPEEILSEVRRYVDQGITLTTIGFGMDNYNDVLMEQLADNGNGFYAYVDTPKEARRLFIDNLTSTLQVIALNAKVQVDFNPAVVSRYRLVGFENRAVADEQFRDNSVDAGEVGAGHSVTALYEIKLNREAYGRIARVFMRWEEPDTHQVTEISRDIDTREMARDFRSANPYFQRSVVVAEYAEILRHSYWAKEVTLDCVYDEALQVEELLPHDADMNEFVSLVQKARQYQSYDE